MFRPSEKSAALALEASRTLGLEMQARTAQRAADSAAMFSSVAAPEARSKADIGRVQDVLAEQLIGLLMMLGRQRACREPGSRLPVTEAKGFRPEVERHLCKQFRFPRQHPQTAPALQAFAADLLGWVKNQPGEADSLGLAINAQNQLILLCRLVPSVLPPLVE
ncbi:MAG TPA: hypothetical protein VH643_14555 [Gemmataceae bacterium]|jgi:hypothetical protein